MSPRAVKLEGDESVAARVIDELARTIREAEDFAAEAEHVQLAAIALGWMIRASRTAQGVVVLHRHELGHESAPMARSVMEHAMKLHWLVQRPDSAIETITFDHRRYQSLLKQSMEKGGWDLEGIDDELPSHEDLTKPGGWSEFRNFENVLDAIERDEFYAAYRLESSFSHATYLSGAAYWDYERFERGEPGYGWRPAVAVTPLRATAANLALCLEAGAEVVQSETIASALVDARTSLKIAEDPAT